MVLPIFFKKTRELATWTPSTTEGEAIIAKLPLKYQDGILFEENELIMYLLIWAASFVLFRFIYSFWETSF